MRDVGYDPDGWVVLGVGRRAGDGSEHAAWLLFSEKLFSSPAPNRVGDRIDGRKRVQRVLVIQRDELVGAESSGRGKLLLQHAGDDPRLQFLSGDAAERPTPPNAPTTSTVCPALISAASETSWLPVAVTSGKAAASMRSRPSGTFARSPALTTQSSAYVW